MAKKNSIIAVWLFSAAAAVFLMALIGAVTRLTESGLSIVEWKPVVGALPPLSSADWEKEFSLYQQSPQYIKINQGMSIDEFKNIYLWEWVHRLWGRMIGLIYALPLVYFWARKKLPEHLKKPALVVLGLGFLQGAMGWYMVKSGLVDLPAVSHYRLAAHLMLAFLIYAAILKMALSIVWTPPKITVNTAKLRKFTVIALGLAVLTMIWGAFVAGLRAGHFYNTFPTMDGYWLPPELFLFKPLWQAFFADPAVVQFTHRVLAILAFLKIMALWRKSAKMQLPSSAAAAFRALGCAAILQVILGISTLLTNVNIVLAALHQAGAMLVLTLLITVLHVTEKRAEKAS